MSATDEDIITRAQTVHDRIAKLANAREAAPASAASLF